MVFQKKGNVSLYIKRFQQIVDWIFWVAKMFIYGIAY